MTFLGVVGTVLLIGTVSVASALLVAYVIINVIRWMYIG